MYRLVLFARHGGIHLLTGSSASFKAFILNFAKNVIVFHSFYSLLVEEIDLGDGNLRQVVSGLAKFCSPDDLLVSTNYRMTAAGF